MSLKRSITHGDESSGKRRRIDNSGTLSSVQAERERCINTFKRILPSAKYDELHLMIEQLNTSQLSIEEFDKRYFGIILPYVIPKVCPPRYINGNLPSFTLDEDTKKKFLNFFNASTKEREEALIESPDLIPILRHLVYILRPKVPIVGNVSLVLPEDKVVARNNSDEIVSLKGRIEELEHKLLMYIFPEIKMLQNMTYNELSELELTQEKLLSHIREAKNSRYQERLSNDVNIRCSICMSSGKNILYIPCSHVVQCEKCHIPNVCPICNKEVRVASRIYL